MFKSINKIKTIMKSIRPIFSSGTFNSVNTSVDEAKFISDYLNQHPDKKYNWFLKKDLGLSI